MKYKKYGRESIQKNFEKEMRLSNIKAFISAVLISSCFLVFSYVFLKNSRMQTVELNFKPKEELKISPFADRRELLSKLSSSTNMITNSERLVNRKIRVMIIDTEIDVQHPFLAGFFNTSFKDRTKYGKYAYDHGTHVSGIIATRLMEVFGANASEYVEFIPCQYYGTDKNNKFLIGQSYKKEVACLRQALREKVDIVNLSGGGTEFVEEEEKVIHQLEKDNITVVVAAGNERGSSLIFFPCNVKATNIVCVGNVDQYGRKHVSSNDGPNVSYVAYGTNELSSLLQDGFGYMTGTSQATPQVTALLVAKKITLSEKVSNTIIAHGMIVKRELPKEINLNRSIASLKESK